MVLIGDSAFYMRTQTESNKLKIGVYNLADAKLLPNSVPAIITEVVHTNIESKNPDAARCLNHKFY